MKFQKESTMFDNVVSGQKFTTGLSPDVYMKLVGICLNDFQETSNVVNIDTGKLGYFSNSKVFLADPPIEVQNPPEGDIKC